MVFLPLRMYRFLRMMTMIVNAANDGHPTIPYLVFVHFIFILCLLNLYTIERHTDLSYWICSLRRPVHVSIDHLCCF